MTDDNLPKIGGLLLAAGGSSRLGQPKQLLRFQGKTLLRRSAETLVATSCSPVVVVLGASIDVSLRELDGLELSIFENLDWQTGMSSSIRSGLASLLDLEPELDAVVITLCDQPLVTSEHLDSLITGFVCHGFPIFAARYGETTGVPALFASRLFGDLLGLEGDKGARQIIRDRPNVVQTVDMAEAGIDIDSVGDYENLINASLIADSTTITP